jgi:ABC-type lipoprotein export system ATPase subunit
MSSICFDIENAVFNYTHDKPVLKVNSLQIHRGKVYFIIGRSGIGKSTLVEALGLMNNTINNQSTKVDFFDSAHRKLNFVSLFGHKKEVLKIRREEFSFIFQETNLMSNLTAGENLVLTTLDSNESYDRVKTNAERLLDKFHLSNLYDRKIQHLSGGQRQRLAFIRAFISDYSILFGDEPTGNLDPVTGRIIMNQLREEIIEKNKTCIVVSHDIGLAVEIADEIILITPTKEKNLQYNFGIITPENCFSKIDDGKWVNNKTIVNQNIKDHLLNKLKESYE